MTVPHALRPTELRSPRPWVMFVLGWACSFAMCLAWSLSSPVSSAPDESGHIMKAAATARGDFVGDETDQQGITTFVLPRDIGDVGHPMTCFVGDLNLTASCQPSLADYGSNELTVYSGVGSYNPFYYAVVGVPSLFLHGEAAVIGMRAVSALLNSFFIGILFLVASWSRRSPAFLGWVAVALTPMTIYLGGVVNPNGVEITACAALTALLWLVVHDDKRSHLRIRMLLLAISIVVAVNTRATSPVFVAVIMVAVLITVRFSSIVDLFRERAVILAVAVSAVAVAGAGAWTVLIAAPGGFIPSSIPERDDYATAFQRTLLFTDEYGQMMIGRLGWLEIHLGEFVYVGWTVAFGFVIVSALLAGRARPLIGAVVLMVATLLAPALIQSPVVEEFGYIWQGRYGLPLLTAAVLVSGLVAEGHSLRRETAPRIVILAVSLAALAQTISFALAYKRYSAGVGASWSSVLSPNSWQAPGGFVLLLALFATGAVGSAAVAIFVSSSLTNPAPQSSARNTNLLYVK